MFDVVLVDVLVDMGVVGVCADVDVGGTVVKTLVSTVRTCGAPRGWTAPSTLCEESAPSAFLDYLKARGSPTHHGVPPEQLGS